MGSCNAPDGRSGAEFSPSSASTTLPRRHLGPEAPPLGRVLDTIFASAAPSPAGDCTHASAPIPAPAASDHHQYHCERHGGDTPRRKPEQQMQLLHKHICSCSRHRWPLVAGEASKSLLLLSHWTNSCSARQARTMVLSLVGRVGPNLNRTERIRRPVDTQGVDDALNTVHPVGTRDTVHARIGPSRPWSAGAAPSSRPSLASCDDILAFTASNAETILSGGRIRDEAIRRGRGDGVTLSADAADAALLGPAPLLQLRRAGGELRHKGPRQGQPRRACSRRLPRLLLRRPPPPVRRDRLLPAGNRRAAELLLRCRRRPASDTTTMINNVRDMDPAFRAASSYSGVGVDTARGDGRPGQQL